MQTGEWGRISSGVWFPRCLWTVHSLPPATGTGRALVTQGSICGDYDDAQPCPWLGRHPVCSISAVVSSCSPLLISPKNIISHKTMQERRGEVGEVVSVWGLLQGQAGHGQRLTPARKTLWSACSV